MRKFSPYPRRAYSDLFKAWRRRNAKLLAVAAAVTLVLLIVETVLILQLLPDSDFKWWVLGALQTALVAVVLHLLSSAFLAHEREAIWQLRGAWGEEATRDVLARAKRRRVVWGWVDSIPLKFGDLDHLVLTREGGFVAIDSKWRSDAKGTDDIVGSASRVKLRAEALTRTLLASERGGHRAKVHAAAVRPLVVIWGPAQHKVPDGFTVDGIEFVGGQRLFARLQALSGDHVDKLAAKDALARLREFRSEVPVEGTQRS